MGVISIHRLRVVYKTLVHTSLNATLNAKDKQHPTTTLGNNIFEDIHTGETVLSSKTGHVSPRRTRVMCASRNRSAHRQPHVVRKSAHVIASNANPMPRIHLMPRKRRCAPQASLRSPQPGRVVRVRCHRVRARQRRRRAPLAHFGVLVVDLACRMCRMCLACLAQRRQSTERRDTGVEPRADATSVLLGGGAHECGQERGFATLAARRSDALPRRHMQAVSRTGRDIAG